MDTWSKIENNLTTIFDAVKSFVIDNGTKIYEDLVNLIGETPAKMTVIVAVIVIVLFVVLKIINK